LARLASVLAFDTHRGSTKKQAKRSGQLFQDRRASPIMFEIMFSKNPDLEIQMAIFATEEKLTFNDICRTSRRVVDLIEAGTRL
jgi:hypothetical protein